jgi:hypothetical protein
MQRACHHDALQAQDRARLIVVANGARALAIGDLVARSETVTSPIDMVGVGVEPSGVSSTAW